MSPTPRAAAIVAACALFALLVPGEVAFAAIGIVLVAIAIDAAFARRSPRLVRSVPILAPRGVAIPLVVEAKGTMAGNVQVRQPRAPDLVIDPAEARHRLETTIVARRRGHHTLPSVAARRAGPFGLATWQFRGDGTGDLTVFPDVVLAKRLAIAVRRGELRDEAGLRRRGPLGLGTEFETLREYQPDDDIRLVNWAATARTQHTMSNQFRVEQDREIICLLDTGRLMRAPVGDRTRLDVAVDVVTALAAVTDEVGDRVGVIAFDHEIRRNLATRRRGADAVVRAIHDLEPRIVDSNYELAFGTVRNTKRALVVVLTDVLDEGAARSLTAAVPVLARRHAVLVASVVDPSLDAIVDRSPTNPSEYWEAAAARELRGERDHVVARLRHTGAVFVDARPDLLPEAAVRSYLRLKARARL